MEPSAYVPLYLEREYRKAHPELTDAGRALVHDEIARDPERFAATDHARLLVAYARAHDELMRELDRLEDVPDEEFEQKCVQLFGRARVQMHDLWRADEGLVDARLVDIQLAEVPLDACLSDMLALEKHVRERLAASRPGFSPELEGLWEDAALANGMSAEELTSTDPEVIGWLHVVEALSQGCIFTARYRAAATYARQVMRAAGYPNIAVGTLLLALARLEDEDGFFEAVRAGGDGVEDLPWFLLGRTILLYKLGQRRSARRALRDFANRCEGGAFFLLNPTYRNPYLPVRPPVREAWELSHQAVWEADGIIADTPDFAVWAEGVEGIREISEDFALRNGF